MTVLQDYKPSLSKPCSSCAPPTPRTSPAPLRPAAVLARLVTKGVTQKRSQNETGLRSTLLPVLYCLIPRTYIDPFWIPLTLKEKQNFEVCLQRVFTRLAGVGLERLDEEAHHRRLVMVFLKHNTRSRNWVWCCTASRARLPGPGPLLWTSAALHKPNVLVSLRRHIKTQRDRADVSCQNINSDKACPGTKSFSGSSGSSGNGGTTRHRRLVKNK